MNQFHCPKPIPILPSQDTIPRNILSAASQCPQKSCPKKQHILPNFSKNWRRDRNQERNKKRNKTNKQNPFKKQTKNHESNNDKTIYQHIELQSLQIMVHKHHSKMHSVTTRICYSTRIQEPYNIRPWIFQNNWSIIKRPQSNLYASPQHNEMEKSLQANEPKKQASVSF